MSEMDHTLGLSDSVARRTLRSRLTRSCHDEVDMLLYYRPYVSAKAWEWESHGSRIRNMFKYDDPAWPSWTTTQAVN